MAGARRISLGEVVAGGAIAALAALVLWFAAPLAAESGDPNALWRIVHTLCATDMKVSGNPAPCTRVDLAKGYAVLKDIRGDTQLLLIPTDRVTGIEAPELLAPDAPNYFEDAWDSRPLFEARVGHAVPRGDLALAINSLYGRSQQQLHIHVDCVRVDVRDALAANQDRIGRRWAMLYAPLAGRRYEAMRLEGEDLGDRNPFKLLAEQPGARADMARETLAVIGARFRDGRPGFVLLSDRADPVTLDQGTAEDLMDHSCKVLRP
ncbi:MAG TPA: CDP-diacylglycerol diphosphatase [Caulobacteraceae bacterium]|nr:CDP-diacylglycerol diphosphatase [Caulobacteraceae bacterium]